MVFLLTRGIEFKNNVSRFFKKEFENVVANIIFHCYFPKSHLEKPVEMVR